jgi:predicted dithiol-disulfide oxidoreductase (DUF899 family)
VQAAFIVQSRIVARDEWIAERKTLLAREKELIRLRDQIAGECRALPWVHIDRNYVFETPAGRRTLGDLFDGRRQLLAQHFMLAPGWEQGCPSCSFMADHSDGMTVHLAHREVTLVAVSRAPLSAIERFRRRMGWQFTWVSSHGSDFNYDFGVSFTRKKSPTVSSTTTSARGLSPTRNGLASACSSRTMRMRSSTPTRPTDAA